MFRFVLLWFFLFIRIASHCYVMSLLCLCAFVTLNKRLLTYLLTYLLTVGLLSKRINFVLADAVTVTTTDWPTSYRQQDNTVLPCDCM